MHCNMELYQCQNSVFEFGMQIFNPECRIHFRNPESKNLNSKYYCIAALEILVGTTEDVRLHIALREVIVQTHSYRGNREIY